MHNFFFFFTSWVLDLSDYFCILIEDKTITMHNHLFGILAGMSLHKALLYQLEEILLHRIQLVIFLADLASLRGLQTDESSFSGVGILCVALKIMCHWCGNLFRFTSRTPEVCIIIIIILPFRLCKCCRSSSNLYWICPIQFMAVRYSYNGSSACIHPWFPLVNLVFLSVCDGFSTSYCLCECECTCTFLNHLDLLM